MSVTVNGVMTSPAATVSLAPLVITGAWYTVSTKAWLTGEPTPFVAVIVIG